MKLNKLNLAILSMLAAAALMLGGCSTPKKIAYLQDVTDGTVLQATPAQSFRLQPGDKLSIVVHSKDPQLSAMFNLPIVTSSNRSGSKFNGTGATTSGNYTSDGQSVYTVNSRGMIHFPILGDISVSGMTRDEVEGFIEGEITGKNLIKDPTVVVQFLSTGINVLGEVNQPGRYDLMRDNLNILEALALAGDLKIQGQRENVKVIRENADGTVRVYTVDLTKGEQLMKSPVFYLKQNDVVYVEPNNLQKRSTTVNGNTALSASFWISVASFLTSVAVLIFK